MRLAIILCSLVFASSAFLVHPAEAQPLGSSTLSGNVCLETPWGACDERLPGASVRVVGGGVLGLAGTDKTVKSDSDGRYEVRELHDQSYQVTISHPGFKTQTATVPVSGSTQRDFTLVGESVEVAGIVEDANGKPVAGAYVSLWGRSSSADARTDAMGGFIVNLTAGWYEVYVDSRDSGYFQDRILINGSDLVLAFQPLAGQEARLVGRVLDQHGAPVADARITVDQWEAVRSDGTVTYGNHRNGTRTDEAGRYSIDVYGGGLSIQVSKPGHAQVYEYHHLNATQTLTRDFELLKYPPKTAHITGTIRNAAGQALPFAVLSIQLPEYGLYECSDSGRYGYAMAEPAYADDVAYSSPGPYEPYQPEPCAIQMDGGSFAGNVTPGYAIISVWYDRWRACDESHHADGSYERRCGPDYFSYSQTVTLPADASTAIDIVLEQRPGPDASISGYLVDVETGKAVPKAWISFRHQDAHAWGSASADADGSYKVRLRSGYQHVEVWAEGYLPWQGVVKIAAGQETPFDVPLTKGQARYGGCCYGHVYAAEDTGMAKATPASSPTRGGGDSGARAPTTSGSSGSEYEDLGGGLGPYDADARAQLLSSTTKGKDAPAPLAFAAVALALVLWVRRR